MSVERLLTALNSTKPVSGLTHSFYRYPARMSPELANEIIGSFSDKKDLVLDPFMGGGTSIVEAMACGRQALGVDLNPLAVFVTTVKTTPLSTHDTDRIRQWADNLDFSTLVPVTDCVEITESRTRNLPASVQQMLSYVLRAIDDLPLPRQQRFARCVLLRVGQWAVDCKTAVPEPNQFYEKVLLFMNEMLDSLAEFVAVAQSQGIAKNKLTRQRTLLLRSAVDLHQDQRLREIVGDPKLVLTSPPYPGVHVLYHRWQVEGRRETPAPYWLIASQDGKGEAYYTLGGRSEIGLSRYFHAITEAYRSIRTVIHPDALVVQLVAFSDTETQLPAFLAAMEQAGYYEDNPLPTGYADLWRRVPHRKWYNYISTARSGGQELLLFHRANP